MTENEKNEKNANGEKKKNSDVNRENAEKSSWSEDQKNRGYYYDDASGYEVYLPDEDDDEEDKPADKK